MKKFIFSIMFVMLASMAWSATRNIAVMTFEVTGSSISKADAEAITELYISGLVATGKVSVIDRANFDKILKEMKFQKSDWSDSKKTAELGRVINADLVVIGKIIKLGSKLYLSTSLLDVSSAMLLSSAKEEFSDIDDLVNKLDSLAQDLVANMPKEKVKPLYNVGDKGPCGGTIFFVDAKSKDYPYVYYEVIKDLGSAKSPYEAEIIAKKSGRFVNNIPRVLEYVRDHRFPRHQGRYWSDRLNQGLESEIQEIGGLLKIREGVYWVITEVRKGYFAGTDIDIDSADLTAIGFYQLGSYVYMKFFGVYDFKTEKYHVYGDDYIKRQNPNILAIRVYKHKKE